MNLDKAAKREQKDPSSVPRLRCVVLNWNKRELTASCVSSLLKSDYRQLTVTVVDDGSSDMSVAYLRDRFPSVHVVALETSHGYTGAANAGIEAAMEAGCDLIWLLNNDLEVDRSCASRLVNAFQGDECLSIASPVIYYFDDPSRIWYQGGRLSAVRASGMVLTGHNDVGPPTSSVAPPTFMCGCAPIFRTEVVDAVGKFDEDLYMYGEDLDWSIRATRAGLRMAIVPQAAVWHKVARQYVTAPTQAYLMARNRFVVHLQHERPTTLLLALPLFLLGSLARRSYTEAIFGRPQTLISMMQGVRDGLTRKPVRRRQSAP